MQNTRNQTSRSPHGRRKRLLPLAAAAVSAGALLIAGSATTSATASTSVHPPLPSSNTVIFGAFTQLPGKTLQTSVTARESQLKRKYAVNSHYYDWADSFPGVAEKADAAQGRTVMDTWWGIDPRKIVNGSQDALIRARAKAVAAFGRPMFLRWGAEMNGDWYAWSGTAVGNKPSVFVAAWRHIHDVFARAGVRNVAWVWAPNADSHPGGTSTTSWNSWRNYYPGDAYVDWVGIDGYNWGSKDSWQTFGQVFGPVYADYAGRKPIMIAETGSLEPGGNKAAWLSDASRWIKAHRGIKAFVYFDTNRSSSKLDWRADSSPSALNAYISMARDPYFSGRPR
ncbi:glycoside hydrolase family 26 protein [Terrabacter sp. BE26]|uniref:glycoside hydrolase family 26 protein n=1 Tax=Terrabacter sp. BE26 TaxID=2898152 RepID=UPI0035BE4984